MLKGAQVEDNNTSMALQEILEDEEVKQMDISTKVLEVQQGRELDELLQKHSEIFAEPQGLPPKRSIEHAINMKPGSGPVNVRPYKYAYHHKDEIERQVNGMLQTGIIKHSIKPFSSPVILLKKKDGSWRLCGL